MEWRERKPYKYLIDKNIEEAKQFCQDNCILSGCRTSSVYATLYYLQFDKTKNKVGQDKLGELFDISTVSMRNNIHKVQKSPHYETIMKILRPGRITRYDCMRKVRFDSMKSKFTKISSSAKNVLKTIKDPQTILLVNIEYNDFQVNVLSVEVTDADKFYLDITYF